MCFLQTLSTYLRGDLLFHGHHFLQLLAQKLKYLQEIKGNVSIG